VTGVAGSCGFALAGASLSFAAASFICASGNHLQSSRRLRRDEREHFVVQSGRQVPTRENCLKLRVAVAILERRHQLTRQQIAVPITVLSSASSADKLK
jgi:hypothetical protein